MSHVVSLRFCVTAYFLSCLIFRQGEIAYFLVRGVGFVPRMGGFVLNVPKVWTKLLPCVFKACHMGFAFCSNVP